MGFQLSIDFAQLHRECRNKVILNLRKAGATGVALLKGGEASFRHDTDHEHLFRQESYFHYLFGINIPDLLGLLDISTGEAHLFIPRLDVEYEVWCGKIIPPRAFAENYGIDHVHYLDEIEKVVCSLDDSHIHILSGVNSDSKRAIVEINVEAIVGSALRGVVMKDILYKAMVDARTVKTEMELTVLRHVNRLSSKAHISVMQNIKPGMMEFQLESMFLSYTSFEGGCRYSAYTCICGTGQNGAILHYGHSAAPNDKQIRDGDMCLLDMGSEYHCYASDITCSYPASGIFSKKQREIYTAVLNALKAVRNTIRAGVEWSDMHLLAERNIVEKLVEMEIIHLNGKSLEEVIELEIGALFFPHGLGHLMGMDTHDVGGYPEGKGRHDRSGLKSLRLNRKLEAGMVLTNEPGCYFIEALLRPAFENPKFAPYLNKNLILEEYLDFGGVRLEEDLIVTETGCENMTNVPREIDDIEAIMSSGRKQ